MENPIKKVAAIHDLSGYGRTSLAAIIPIISSMGIQLCPFPTAVLSNNTGYFDEFSFADLTDSMEDYMDHWKKENIIFDCIYSGFLGSGKQVDIVLNFIESFKKPSNIVVVDPVMGDHGKLYPTIDEDMVEKMKTLVGKADIITPNFTEATYLLGKDYSKNIKEDEVKDILIDLSNLGPNIVVITSVEDMDIADNIDVFAYDKKEDKFWKIGSKHIPAEFPGTGDIFTSVLIGSLLNGHSLPMSLDKSVQFITACIKKSCDYSYPRRQGILLETSLDLLKVPIIDTSYEILR